MGGVLQVFTEKVLFVLGLRKKKKSRDVTEVVSAHKIRMHSLAVPSLLCSEVGAHD